MLGISGSTRREKVRRSVTLAAGLAAVLAAVVGAAAAAGGAPTTAAATTADMSIVKDVTPTRAAVGQKLTYTLHVTNNGPGTATNVVGADRLPPEVKFE